MEDMEKRFDRLVARAIKVNAVNDGLADELRGMVDSLSWTTNASASPSKHARPKTTPLRCSRRRSNAWPAISTTAEANAICTSVALRQPSRRAGGGGIANIMEAGMAGDDPRKEQKLGLLKDVFDQNQEMRDALKGAAAFKIASRPEAKKIRQPKKTKPAQRSRRS